MSWDWRQARAATRSLASIAGHEFRATIRERAGWGAIVAACVLSFVDSAIHPLTPLVSGVRASLFGGSLILPFLAIILAAGAARRDQATSAADVIGARPYRSHLRLLARVLSNYAVVLFAYALVIASTLAAPLAFAGQWPSPLIFIHSFGREIVPLFFVVALAYCAVSVAGNVLAAAVVAVYALFVFLWGDYLARIFNPTLTQNWPTYGLIGLGVLLTTMGWAEWVERAEGRRRGRRFAPALGAALMVIGVLYAWHQVATTHSKPLHMDPFALNMGSQDLRACPRAPGFWLPDQHGRDFRISSVDGRALVLAFWSPHVPESMRVLDTLQATGRELADSGGACVAVCLADDHAISGQIAREGRYAFPMVTDTGTHFSRPISGCSPVAEAYNLPDLPVVIVTDSARRITTQLGASVAVQPELVVAEARKALAIPRPPS